MKISRFHILFLFLCVIGSGLGQSSFFQASDSLNKKRLIGISSGTGAAWAGSMIGLYSVWYSKEDQSAFHTFNDSKNWLQMDKVGHVYTSWKIATLTGDMFKWTGLDNRRSAIIGSAIGWGYQATLETFDGFSTNWGFSWADMGSNTIGTGGYLIQELIWNEQKIIPKFSSHMTEYAQYRPEILGSNFSERLLKDYNGQTYWLSFSPGSFLKSNQFPEWLCLSIGYSVDAKLVGDSENYSTIHNGQAVSFSSQREFLTSIDIDFSKIKTKKPWLNTLLKQLNYLKLPFPAIRFTKGATYLHPLYF